MKEQIKIKHQNPHQNWLDRKNECEEAHNKARSKLLADYCTKDIETKLKKDPEWEKFGNDLVKIAPVIRLLMHCRML